MVIKYGSSYCKWGHIYYKSGQWLQIGDMCEVYIMETNQ